MRSKKLTHLLESLDCGESQREVTFADIVDALEHRGFGPLLIAPALITILPTGAIPGVPAVCASVICLIAGQIVLGRKRPWMPARLGNLSMKRKHLEEAIGTFKPYAEALDEVVYPRFEFLTHQTIQRLIAVICVALGLVMAFFGFIPFLPMVAALPILMFAIGLSLKDGLLTLSGFIFSIAMVAILPFLLSLLK